MPARCAVLEVSYRLAATPNLLAGSYVCRSRNIGKCAMSIKRLHFIFFGMAPGVYAFLFAIIFFITQKE
jgi:hypothetical protein